MPLPAIENRKGKGFEMADEKPVYYFRNKAPIDSYGNITRWPEMTGRHCELICRGGRNNRLVRFLDDGELVVIGGNALRRLHGKPGGQAARKKNVLYFVVEADTGRTRCIAPDRETAENELAYFESLGFDTRYRIEERPIGAIDRHGIFKVRK